MILEKVYDELMAQIEDLKKAVAAMGGGGTDDYDDLNNRPKVNNITLTGNKKSSDLKITYSMTETEYAAATKNAESIYCLQENASEVTETADDFVISWEQSGDDYVATLSYTPSNQNVTAVTGVTCDSDTITIESYSLVDGDVIATLSTSDPAEVPESVEFTFTMTQPIGATRIVKDGVDFGTSAKVETIYSAESYAASGLLTKAISNYDLLVVGCRYSGSTPGDHRIVDVIPVSMASIDITTTGHGWYVEHVFPDTTHINTGTRLDGYVSDVIGIKL